MGSIAEQLSVLIELQRQVAELEGRAMPALAPPASRADLDAVERHIGPLPSTLVELLQVADGWTDFFFAADDRPVRVFSCAELVAPEYATFVAAARARHGFKKETALQTGFIFGGHDDHVLVISTGPQKGRLTGLVVLDGERVTEFSLKPPGTRATGTLEQVLAVHASGVEHRITQARAALQAPASTADEAIENFNCPGEMGDDVHESVEALRAIVERMPKTDGALPAVRRLLAELSKGYVGEMRFSQARRRGHAIEVHDDGRWVDLMEIDE